MGQTWKPGQGYAYQGSRRGLLYVKTGVCFERGCFGVCEKIVEPGS